MRKPKGPCREINCSNLTRDIYCEIHKKKSKETDRIYNQYKRNDRLNTFYQFSEWKRVPLLALDRDNHLCLKCLKQGILQSAQMVHHIVEVKDDWTLRLALENLESLCHKCHNRLHKSTPPGFIIKNFYFLQATPSQAHKKTRF